MFICFLLILIINKKVIKININFYIILKKIKNFFNYNYNIKYHLNYIIV